VGFQSAPMSLIPLNTNTFDQASKLDPLSSFDRASKLDLNI